MRLYPPSWCFSNFCWSKASSFIKSILFGSPPIRFRFEIPALPLKFTSCLDSKPMFSGCTSPLFAVQIFCWSQSPIVSIEIQCVFQFGQVQSHCSQRYSEVFFLCGATILFSGSHNPLPCFYPLVLGVCYCSWFRQCFGAEFSPWFVGQSAGRVETNPLVLDGIFMGLYIYVHQPRICIFFAGYLADWPW